MPEHMISERAWRRDPGEALAVPGTSERNEATEPRAGLVARSIVSVPNLVGERSMTVPFLPQWSRTAQIWARAFLERFAGVPVEFEQVLHSFVVVLETAHDRAAVEA